MPCIKHDDLLLFTFPLIWSEALAYLRRIGLEMAAPRSLEEISYLSQIIQENHQFCSVEVRTGYLAWIGVRLNTSSGKVEDARGEEYKMTNISRTEDISNDRNYAALFTSGELQLRTEMAACFTARQPEPVVFYLQALHEHTNIQLAHILKAGFVLSSEGEKGSHFHGIGPYNIRQEGKSPLWCLHETNPAVGTSSKVVCTISHLLPLGTRKWTSHGNTCQNKENETIELILTRCTDDQYTCPDATCIDLSSRCDFKFDCQDRSDESRCATALLDKDYQKDIPPNIPLSIKAYISFEDIREFSLLSKTFEVYMNVTLLWFDPWLTFLHLASAEERDVVTAEGQEIWKPHLEVLKSVESIGIVNRLYVKRKSEGSTSLLGYTYKGSENPLILEMGLKSIVNCNFQLQMYPWDEQECEVKILVTNVLPDGVNVSRDSQVVYCPIILDQYHVRGCSLREGTLTLLLRLSRATSTAYGPPICLHTSFSCWGIGRFTCPWTSSTSEAP
ncbi:uncharacterized protein LOC119588815 [Penaeus monodon]|uniref:uncharacterized protein LOC119588815 n=1 Tax=Penaeus monodon TaxID=6687 RepID=UPI0018A7B2EF|nr:uncharacterized protein LOC119588815 [Penaeus monodon]